MMPPFREAFLAAAVPLALATVLLATIIVGIVVVVTGTWVVDVVVDG
jgi:hypothetical protein